MDQFIVKPTIYLDKLSHESLIDLLIEKLNIDSEKPCLIDCTFDRKWSKRQVLDSSLNFGYYLINECKLSKGDIVCFVTENSDIHAIGIIGVLVAGGVYVSLPDHSTPGEIIAMVDNIKPSILVFTSTNYHAMKQVSDEFSFAKKLLVIDEKAKNAIDVSSDLETIEGVFEQKRGDLLLPIKTGLDDIATLVMSSGSTGLPKAVIRTNKNLLAARAVHRNPLPPESIQLSSSFVHNIGQGLWFSTIVQGSQLAIVRTDEDNDDVLQKIHKYEITHGFIVPTLLTYLAKNSEKYDKTYLKSLQNVGTGGAALSEDVFRIIVEKYGFEKFRIGFGMSEAGGLFGADLYDPKNVNKCKSIGKVFPGVEAKVIDQEGNSLPPNQHGEICVRTATATPGYLNNDKDNANLFTKDGFARSGDYGYYDEQEYFYIISRIKQFINVEAVLVSPIELELILLQNENIENAAVIGINDEERGEIPMAFVTIVSGSTITAQEIQDFVDSRVNYFKKLRGGVRIIDSFPLTSSRKISKQALKQMLS